jgi:hypothetical protein
VHSRLTRIPLNGIQGCGRKYREDFQEEYEEVRMAYVVKAVAVLVALVFGMVAGAMVLYMVAGAIYLIQFPGPVTNSYECARGMYFGWTSLLVGALFGGGLMGFKLCRLFDGGSNDAHTVTDL